jgi:hypothetical protein
MWMQPRIFEFDSTHVRRACSCMSTCRGTTSGDKNSVSLDEYEGVVEEFVDDCDMEGVEDDVNEGEADDQVGHVAEHVASPSTSRPSASRMVSPYHPFVIVVD